jgi:Lon-like protease
MNKQKKKNIFQYKIPTWYGLIIICIFLLGLFLPTGYAVLKPGKAVPASEVVNMNTTSPNSGVFFIVPVDYYSNIITPVLFKTQSIDVSVDGMLASLFIPNTKRLKLNQQFDENMSYQEFENYLTASTEEGKYGAIVASLRYTNTSYSITGDGVLVSAIKSDSFLNQYLKDGDIIITINNKLVETVGHFNFIINSTPLTANLTFAVLRENSLINITIPIEKKPLGFYGYTKNLQLKTKVPLGIKSSKLQGSSSGLILSLELVSRLQNKDLTKGRKIAGTGTVTADGKVVEINDVNLKLKSAQTAGATIFFLPKENSKEINTEKYPTMTIVPVDTLDEAVMYLENLN